VRFLHDTPIKRKLIIITMLPTALAIAVAGGTFAVVDQIMLRRSLAVDLSATAEMLGFNSASALSFNDASSAEQTLKSLVAQPQIRAARVYDRDGTAFASYRRSDAKDLQLADRAGPEGAILEQGTMLLSRRIVFDGEVIGAILLCSDLTKIDERLGLSGLVFGLVTLGAGFLAYGVVSRLQRIISGPVSHLAQVTGRVTRESNYALRATKRGQDEVGQLIDGFNEMLVQIQAREGALQKAHDLLETRVGERTRELATSVSLLNATLDSTTDGIVALNHDREVVCCNSKFIAMWGLPPDMVARANAAEITAFSAAQTRAPAWYAQRIADTTAGPDVHCVDTIELTDGRTFERYVHPQRINGRDAGVVVSYRNITERIQAEEQVAVERARLKFIFESVPVGISLVVPGREETHVVNPAFERITGISAADLGVPGSFERATHPEDFARQRDLVRQFKDGKIDHFSLEKRYVHREGKIVWVALTRRMFVDPMTKQRQSITTVIDISDVKAAQEEVARERARFKFIFEAVPVGISLVAPGEADSVVVNPAHVKITGVSAEDSRVPGAFARVSHPDDYRRQLAQTERVLRGEIDHYSVEKRYLHPDGRVVWAVLTNRTFTDAATGKQQSVTTLVDITEVKAAQEQTARQQARFKFIFETVPIGLAWMLNGELPSRIVNAAHARITGVPIDRCQDLELYFAATHAADRQVQADRRRQLEAGEIDHYDLEKRYIHADGATRWAALSVRCFCDPESGEKQQITTLVDITERKQAEASLAETHRQLLVTSRQAGMAEIATGVLHNVGNVLNSVNVSTTLLADQVRQSKIAHVAKLGTLLGAEKDLPAFFASDPRGQKIPGFIQVLATQLSREQADQLKELESLRKSVEHIKDIVAMQQNYAKVSGVSETLVVTELIEDAIRMNAPALNRHDVTLVRDFQVQARVTVDKHKVLQILVNLMRNAKYACDDVERTDKQMTIRVTSAHGRVSIAVIDNGVGIPAENLTKIFRHGFTTRKHGHGFGLHSGANAAKELGGSLIALSDGPGLGATFVLELPEHLHPAIAA
jgi:PAS domain S-box-containing protein